MKAQIRYEGDPVILENLFRKEHFLKHADSSHECIRPVVCVGSGVQRGVFGGGAGIAMQKFGLNHTFDVAVGVSTGAPGIGFFLAGQLDQHLEIYWKEAASENFVSFRNLWTGGGPVVGTDFITKVFRSKMDQVAIRRSRTKFFVAATCVKTGKGHLIDAKTARPDPLEAVHASIAIPRLCGRTVTLDGVEYVDGGAGEGTALPIKKIIEKFAPTDLLILTNCPSEDKETILGSLCSRWLVSGFPEPFKKAYFNRHKDFASELHYLRTERPCRYGILWSDDSIGRFERNSAKLENAALRAQKHFESLLLDARNRLEPHHRR